MFRQEHILPVCKLTIGLSTASQVTGTKLGEIQYA